MVDAGDTGGGGLASPLRSSNLNQAGALEPVLQSLFGIDPNDLHGEWVEHPKRLARLRYLEAELNFAAMQAKMVVEERRAAVAQACRINGIPGIKRVTDAAVEAAVVLDPEYQQAMRNLAQARRRVAGVAALAEAMHARTSSLIRIHELYLSSVSPTDLKREADRELAKLHATHRRNGGG